MIENQVKSETGFDLEITPELLAQMYHKQHELQCYMHEKRQLTMPPAFDATCITHEHVLAAIYFSTCINIEWMELKTVYQEYLNYAECSYQDVPQAEKLRDEALEELIDVWHFLLSVFIFLGVNEAQVSKLHHFRLGGLGSIAEYVGGTSLAISNVLSLAPYKTWKDQNTIKTLNKEYQDILFQNLSVCYNNVLDFAIECLDSSYEEFVNVYLRKNDLNFRRQEDKSLGYIQQES